MIEINKMVEYRICYKENKKIIPITNWRANSYGFMLKEMNKLDKETNYFIERAIVITIGINYYEDGLRCVYHYDETENKDFFGFIDTTERNRRYFFQMERREFITLLWIIYYLKKNNYLINGTQNENKIDLLLKEIEHLKKRIDEIG